MTDQALAGLRVLDWTDESGRLAGRVLAQLGAEVVRLRRGAPGRPLRGVRGGVLEWWYDAGTAWAAVDLDSETGRAHFRRLVAGADVFLETTAPGYLGTRNVDAADLHQINPGLVHVSLTPFGRTGPRAGWQSSDLVTGALSGLLSVCGTPERPLNPWGRQWFNAGGLYVAICALAGVHGVRGGGAGMHFDLSLQHCAISCSEQLLMYWLHMNHVPHRKAALHWSGVYDVMECRNGHVMMTPTPSSDNLMAWLLRDGMAGSLGENPPQNPVEWAGRAREAMDIVRAWALTKEAEPVFFEGQRQNLSFGLVRSVADCAACPQHAARKFFTRLTAGGPRAPRLPFRMNVPEPVGTEPPGSPTPASEIAARWTPRPGRRSGAPTSRPLAGVRVLDFTWVLAGPMATRVFGDLGADVIKVQTEERSTGAGHNEFPFFLMWNRSKRSITLEMKQARAAEIFRRLVATADVIADNFAPGVLERWGVGWDVVRALNPGAIYLAMSGCGDGGPWRDFVTFAPTIQALSGLTYLTNPPDRRDVGIGVSLNDHVSGLFGSVALLAALEQRRRTGAGQFIDLSQLEVGTYLAGPALLEYLDGGREAQPIGNADAFEVHVPNDVYACAGGEWLAITVRDDVEWQQLCGAIGAADLADAPELRTGEGRERSRAAIDARLSAWAATQQVKAAMRTLQAAGVAAGAVQNAQQLTDDDEQLRSRDWMAELKHATIGIQRHDCFPALLDGKRVEPVSAPPILGEHNFDVYRELLGMTDEEIAAGIGEGLFV